MITGSVRKAAGFDRVRAEPTITAAEVGGRQFCRTSAG
jgi:hypothetical protein